MKDQNTVDRVKAAKKAFQSLYQNHAEVVAQSPGRAEIIGNHTDYNNGYALSAGISRYTYTCISRKTDGKIQVFSEGYSKKPEEFEIDNIQKGEHAHWLNYIKGVVYELNKRKPLAGANIYISSDVPSSGGVSSSAALELSVATALCGLFAIDVDPVNKARMCQSAENGSFVGIPCGFLDQASSGLAKKDTLLFLDFLPTNAMPVSKIDYIPFDFSKHGLSFIVMVDKEVKRNLGSSGYPARRKMCEDSISHLSKILGKEIRSLRDVSIYEFESSRVKLKNIDPVMRKRVEHVVYENQRVLDAVEALKQEAVEEFGKILTDSGKSALELYELDEKTPELTKLITKGREIDGVLGIRNMGGGFSAIGLALVCQDALESFQDELSYEYGSGLEYIPFELSQGAEVLTALSNS